MLRRVIVGTSVAFVALAATPTTALAHEGEHGGAPEAFPVTCEGNEYLVTTGNGNWSAARTSEGEIFIPKSFSFTVTINGQVVESETVEKGNGNAHKNQETITCVFGETFTDPETGDVIEFSGSATVVKRP